MIKILLSDYGHYQLSTKAYKLIAQELGKECYFFDWDMCNIIPEENILKGYWHALSSKEFDVHENKFEILPDYSDDRSNPILIKVVETLKQEAFEANLKDIRIAEIPDGTDWFIDTNGETGYEWVAVRHATWDGEKL